MRKVTLLLNDVIQLVLDENRLTDKQLDIVLEIRERFWLNQLNSRDYNFLKYLFSRYYRERLVIKKGDSEESPNSLFTQSP